MLLSKKILTALNSGSLEIPNPSLFDLSEKVLQFGTGVLLRGLPDYFIDQANKKGLFNGRVIVIKSTAQGTADDFTLQDNLYSTSIRGIEQQQTVNKTLINASISRVLDANIEWKQVLLAACVPELEIVISNTTEIGLSYVAESIAAMPPASYPGKLLALLSARYLFHNGDISKGLVIIPTELIPNNGEKLMQLLLELARFNKMDAGFMEWLVSANTCCNSLVDRIVPGRLAADPLAHFEQQVGFEDKLMLMCEPYRLWAIEVKDDRVAKKLSFAAADEGVVLATDISMYRERKLRLLNGPHTFSCGLAFLAGFPTVRQAMADDAFTRFLRQLMMKEIVPALAGAGISKDTGDQYAKSVIDRFQNPEIEHAWIQITLQYSSKMRLRNVPVIQHYLSSALPVPPAICLGIAAFLLFMKCRCSTDGNYFGESNGQPYPVQDSQAAIFEAAWANATSPEVLVKEILSNQHLWGADLGISGDFVQSVTGLLAALEKDGAMMVLRHLKFDKNESA